MPGLLVSYSTILHGASVGWSETGKSMHAPISREPKSAGFDITDGAQAPLSNT